MACYVTAACPPATPRVTLERRCVRGRVVARLGGETNFVRSATFKRGRRTLRRSAAGGAFGRVLPRDSLRGARLRAVVELRFSGAPERLVLSRAGLRCA